MEWISMEDHIPDEEYRCYLVYQYHMGINICKWIGVSNPDRPWEHTGWKLPYLFTHWMPLPPCPDHIATSDKMVDDTENA